MVGPASRVTAPRRNLIIRADGKTVNVPRRQGHLFVCASGCCCGHTERGHAPVPVDLYDREWERRRWRNRVHLTLGGCLGPCVLSNVTMLIFDGRTLYFQSLNSEPLVMALLDYVDAMLAADAYLPPPPVLAELHFTGFRWEDRPDGHGLDDRRPGPAAAADGFLFLTHADTDLLLLRTAVDQLPADFPRVRASGLGHLRNDADVNAFLDVALAPAEVIIVRLMGGRASFLHGLERSGWAVEALEQLGVPVLQAVAVGSSRAQWDASPRGLTPIETAMSVALPEFDGRIITVPISFKEVMPIAPDARFEGTVVRYEPLADRVAAVVALALRYARLRRIPNAQKRIALILTNYNAKASRIGNAVGLDTPASVLRILRTLHEAGYDVGDPVRLPADGDALLAALVERCSYDTELLTEAQLANAAARIPETIYQAWFDGMPEVNQHTMTVRWGDPPGESYVHDGHIALAGLQFGNVFVAIQPPRGYGIDPNLIYHQPDLPPTHSYHALYRWLRNEFRADALVHVGKHGTLEWLPGKAVGLSESCFPDQLLGDLPLIYPFIVNDPGEGAQAKRRTHAVVVDHLTPPMTTADTYGKLDELARLVDEYYQVEALDPSKLPLLQHQIWELVVEARLDADINLMIQNLNRQGDHTHDWDPQVTEDGTPVTLAEMRSKDFAHLIENLDGYLCELGSALIRGGLHTLGEDYRGERLRDLVLAMVRIPNLDVPEPARQRRPGLRPGRRAAGRRSRARACRPTRASARWRSPRVGHWSPPAMRSRRSTIAVGDWWNSWKPSGWYAEPSAFPGSIAPALEGSVAPEAVVRTLEFIGQRLVPSLAASARDEIGHLLGALEGRYVPAGPSGAPTRGMAHVLPTGRNFYAVDARSMPSRVRLARRPAARGGTGRAPPPGHRQPTRGASA